MKISANGIQIHYELSGKEGAPVVVLSHSLSSSLVMWEPQMAALTSRFRVLRYDTRGHGDTEAPEGNYTLEQLGQDALALMDALGFEKVHWVGLSMGGMIGQYLALHHAERLLSLVLCDTAAAISEEGRPQFLERSNTAREKGMQALVEGTLDRWFTRPYLDGNPPDVQPIRHQILNTAVNGYLGCSHAIQELDYLPRLHEIRLSTLIIVGEEDPGTPVAAAESMHEKIEGSGLVVLPSAKHLSNIEQAEAFNDALTAFLTVR